MSVVIFIVILLVLVLVHEFGHFFTAKRFGIRVDEFGFGFPPKLFGFKKGETEYSFNLLPLGGFVKIFGENFEEADFLEVGFLDREKTPEQIELSKRSLVNKPKWQQALVLFAGVFANFLLAWLLFSVGFMSGFPTSVGSEMAGYKLQDVNLVLVSVVPDSPAYIGGLKSGDRIVNLGSGKEILSEINPESLKSFVVSHADNEITVGYIHGKGREVNFTKITPKNNSIGISMDMIGTAKLPFFTAFLEGMRLTWFVAKGTAVGLYTLIKQGVQGKGSFADVAGPVGMVNIVGEAYRFGFAYLMSFAGLISMNLAIINLLPFPALDGGRLFFIIIEKVKGSPISPKRETIANAIGMGLLLLLMVVLTVRDVARLF